MAENTTILDILHDGLRLIAVLIVFMVCVGFWIFIAIQEDKSKILYMRDKQDPKKCYIVIVNRELVNPIPCERLKDIFRK